MILYTCVLIIIYTSGIDYNYLRSLIVHLNYIKRLPHLNNHCDSNQLITRKIFKSSIDIVIFVVLHHIYTHFRLLQSIGIGIHSYLSYLILSIHLQNNWLLEWINWGTTFCARILWVCNIFLCQSLVHTKSCFWTTLKFVFVIA